MENFYTKDCLKALEGRAEIGDFSYGNPNVLRWSEKTILKMGKFCSISGDVTIFLGGNHRMEWVTTYPFYGMVEKWPMAKEINEYSKSKGDVVIGNDVWIGYGATIMSGVVIGDGAVIGARAVVARDVAPYSIVAGNPAREVNKRFNEETIEKLLKIRWWDWPDEKINKHIKLLCSGDMDRFIESVNE